MMKLYPNLGTAKWKKIKNPTPEQRAAHAEAIEKAIRALQRRELMGPDLDPTAPCRDIGAAIRAQHRAALARCAEQERRKRDGKTWREMYRIAMGWTQEQLEAAIDRQEKSA